MAFIFTMRSNVPLPSRAPSVVSADALSTLPESEDLPPPPIAEKSARRSQYLARRFLGEPPRHNHEPSPPPYSDLPAPKGVGLHGVGRGGWIRLVLLTLLVVLAIVGLIVGLVVGMKGKNSSPSSTDVSVSTLNASPASTTTTPTPLANAGFPAGSYAVRTVLSSVLSNCTSNAATWQCYPYSTYASSASASAATFNWIISAWPGPAYTISSTPSPFSPAFANLSLQLLDAGQPTERYSFAAALPKLVVPAVALTPDNAATQCAYNTTTLRASLYTQMASDYPPPAAAAESAAAPGAAFQPWLHAVSVEQVVGGGPDTPACYKTLGGQPGARVLQGITPQPAGELCSCLYINYGLPS